MTPAGKKSPMRVLYVRARPSRNFGKFPLQNLHNEAWISISSVLINISLFFPRNCTLPWVRQRIFLDIKIFEKLLSVAPATRKVMIYLASARSPLAQSQST